MIDSKTRFKLKNMVNELSKHRGSHTELVTVYIPAGYDIVKVIQHLYQEQGTASNIKSTSTRKNVVDALEKMIQHLKLYTKTPPNGLAVFSGNVAEREGQSDVKVWSIEPPVSLNQRLYRCDKEFVLDPLKEITEHSEIYALLVMDRREATLALLKGKTIVPLVNTHSNVPGKFRAGGQSAARFESNRELMAHEFYKRIADYMKDLLLPYLVELKGIIIGGPGPTKYELVESGYILDNLKQKIIGVKDITYTDEFGLQELLDKAQDVLVMAEVADEKKYMNMFFDLLNKQPAKVAYGHDEVKKFLEMSTVDTLLLSETIDPNVIEEFEELAIKYGTTVKIISTETREGMQLRDLGKFAAILRYEANH